MRVTCHVEITLRDHLATKLEQAAALRACELAALLADIIEAVIGDDLIDAVLDDKASRTVPACS